MNRLASTLLLLAAMTCWSLQAQTSALRASIPFEFHMGRAVMPAGNYVIHSGPSAVILREENGKHSALSITNGVSRPSSPKTGILEFNRYGQTYFLAKVFNPDTPDGRALPTTKAEQEYARGALRVLAQTADIPLQRK